MELSRRFQTVKEYYELGGLKLVLNGVRTRVESIARYSHTTDDAAATVSFNDWSYDVSTEYPSVDDWVKYERGVIMPEVKRPMRELLSKGDTFLDVGAYCGDTTLYAHSLVEPNGAVHAFEPDTYLFEILTRNVDPNELQNVHCYNAAVGEQDGEVVPAEALGQVRAEFRAEAEEMDGIDVTTLDGFIRRNDINPTLVKIDVDGAEDKALQGCTDTVLGTIPLILELHDKKLLNDREDVLDRIFDYANDVLYLGAQGRSPNEYRYGTSLTREDSLREDVVVNLLII